MTENPSPIMPKLTPESPVQTPRKIGWYVYFCVIGLVLILLVWFSIFRNGPPLRISPETTHITEPLTPDNRYVDYFAALEQRIYPPEMKTDDNGYRVVLRAIGQQEITSPEQLQQYYEKLGLDYFHDKPTLTFVEPHFMLTKRLESHPEDFDLIFADMDMDDEARNRFRRDWNYVLRHPDFHKLPIIQEWREANDAALNLVAEQVKKPIFVPPYIQDNEITSSLITMRIPGAQEMRSFARGFDTRVRIRVREGDMHGAIDDALACFRLARHAEKQALMVGGLVGIAIEGIAQSMAFDGYSESRANAEQLKRLQDGLAALSPHQGLAEKLEHERFLCLSSMLDIMKDPAMLSKLAGSVGGSRSGLNWQVFGLDWNVVFKKVNGVYDEIIAKTYGDFDPSTNPARLLTLKSRSEAMADIIFALFIPAAEAASEFYHRAECTMNMKRIVLAMHLYEREHGTLPPTFSVDADGKPLHSWRTLLLPYFGDEELAELYAQIRLNEPWDSDHNLPFHQRNLDVYRCPSSRGMPDGETSYAVIVGDDLLFTSDGQGQTFDGHGRNMLMVVERKDDPVCWMCPHSELSQTDAELGIGTRSTPAPIRSNHIGGANFGMRDGGAMFISETESLEFFGELVRGTANEKP